MLAAPLPPRSSRDGRDIHRAGAWGVTGTAPSDRARTRVLVVDDYPMNVELLAASLERLGYEVVGADDGQHALDAIRGEPPDVVLLDVLMPGTSGLEVLRALRGDAATADLPVILVSGLGDSENIVEGLALGANDYVTKPIDMAILQARLATQTALKRARDDLKRTALLLAEEIARNARELAMAAHVQNSILPSSPPNLDGVATAWHYRPATEVGGDLFDVIPLERDRTLLFVADAMGHGVQAALVASTVKATLAAHLHEADDLPRLLGRLDRSLESLFDDRFVTAAACVIDRGAKALHYCVAGHPPILLAGPEGVSALETGGLPLGTALGWGQRSGTVPLPDHARLLLFSDGLIEAEDRAGRPLGLDAIADELLHYSEADAPTILRAIRSALEAHVDSEPLEDDLTILVASVP